MMNSFEVGQKVRVQLMSSTEIEPGTSCRAIIACCEPTAGSYDVIYDNNLYGVVEEENVMQDRIKPREDFEQDEYLESVLTLNISCGTTETPLQGKERGNKLYQLKDYDAAKERYSSALKLLVPGSPSIGSRVLVLNSTGEFVAGTCSGCEDNENVSSTFDVIYDREDAYGVDEEDGIAFSRIIRLASSADIYLQSIIFMNLAKTSLKLHRNGWAIRYSSIGIGLMKSEEILSEELTKKLIDAYFFRSKVFLSVSRPKRAQAVSF